MFRPLAFAIVATAAQFAAAAFPVSAQGYTTRIESRPFYGAVVTLEEGVRVFRPLPPERNVIINPEFKTPLTLNLSETNVHERRIIQNYNSGDGGGARVVYGRGGASWGIGGGASRFGAGQGGHHGARHMHPMHRSGH